jgi:ABC-type glycerol-3-phosphate transport system substrate-binding protein
MSKGQGTTKQRVYTSRLLAIVIAVLLVLLLAEGCSDERSSTTQTLNWYVFDEPSGAFAEVAATCSQQSAGQYTIELIPMSSDADQQRGQLVRRLAARDSDMDILGMDVIWTAEFADNDISLVISHGLHPMRPINPVGRRTSVVEKK